MILTLKEILSNNFTIHTSDATYTTLSIVRQYLAGRSPFRSRQAPTVFPSLLLKKKFDKIRRNNNFESSSYELRKRNLYIWQFQKSGSFQIFIFKKRPFKITTILDVKNTRLFAFQRRFGCFSSVHPGKHFKWLHF